MKIVYELCRELAEDADHATQVRALTLNEEKPLLGLKGTRGLFGSEQWWKNIEKGKLMIVSGLAFLRGSLDDFPTEEQLAKARLVYGMAFVISAALLFPVVLGLRATLRKAAST